MTESDEADKRSPADRFADKLNAWEPPPIDKFVDFFVYGATGTGKTTLTKTLEADCTEHDARALMLTCDMGNDSILSAIYDKRRWLQPVDVTEMDDVREAIVYLQRRDHPFRWVILDDATRMAEIMNDELKQEFGDDVWGRYGALDNKFRAMLRKVRSMDINSLILAREGTKEKSELKTAAFPGKALGEGNNKSSVLHEFTFAFRAVREPRENEDDHFCLQTSATEAAEAKRRDEFNVIADREEPDISMIRSKWVQAQKDNLSG